MKNKPFSEDELMSRPQTMKRIRLCFLGVDGVGKTTLAKELAEHLDWPYYKDTIYKRMFFGNVDYTFYSTIALLQLLEQSKESVIFDRFFWDECVYGPVFGRREIKTIRLLDMFARNIDFRIIYMYKSAHVIQDNVIKEQHQAQLIDNYESLLAWTACPVLRLDVNETDKLKKIIQWLQ